MLRRAPHMLTDRERRFVDEYLVDLNKTQAAIRAGYSARTAGRSATRVAKRPRVAAAITRAMAQRARRTEVDQDRVVQALAAVAFGDPRVLFDENGTMLPAHKLSDAAAAQVAGLDIVATIKEDGRSGYVAKIRTADRIKALELLGRHLGMFQDRSELNDTDGAPPAITVTFVRPGDDGGQPDGQATLVPGHNLCPDSGHDPGYDPMPAPDWEEN